MIRDESVPKFNLSPADHRRLEKSRVAALHRRQAWLRESLDRHPTARSSSYCKAELSALTWVLKELRKYRPEVFEG